MSERTKCNSLFRHILRKPRSLIKLAYICMYQCEPQDSLPCPDCHQYKLRRQKVCHVFLLVVLLAVLFAGQRRLDADLVELLDELSVLVHLEQDVAAADELAFEVHLRDGRPIAELFDAWERKCVQIMAMRSNCLQSPLITVRGILQCRLTEVNNWQFLNQNRRDP